MGSYRPIRLIELVYQVDAGGGRDVFDGHAELGHGGQQRTNLLVEKCSLSIEDVELRISRLGMHQQRDLLLGHHRQGRFEIQQVCATSVGVRGGTGRVEFHSADHASVEAFDEIVDVDRWREVQGHLRNEGVRTHRCGVHDAGPVRLSTGV